jgi:hypothetical protein
MANPIIVMAGPPEGRVPAIHAPGLLTRGHVFRRRKKDVDARHKAGHDDREVSMECTLTTDFA